MISERWASALRSQQHKLKLETNMPKVSFDEAAAQAELPLDVTPAATPPKEIVPAASREIAPLGAPLVHNPALIGEWTTDDIRLPRLNLVAKTGELCDQFTPGVFVIGKEHQLNDLLPDDKGATNPLNVIGIRMKKEYQENIRWEDKESIPTRLFPTAAEVRAAGGCVSRSKGVGMFSELGHIELFIEMPEGLKGDAESPFFLEAGGKRYAQVIYTVGSSAFGAVATTMASALKGHLSEVGLHGGLWQLSSRIIKDAKNSWWSPVLRSAGMVPPETRDEIASIAGI